MDSLNANIHDYEATIAACKREAGPDRGFIALLASTLRAMKSRRRRIHALTQERASLYGIELAHESGRAVALVPEPDGTGKARLVSYDRHGLSGHTVHATPAEALEEALRDGFTRRADGDLDRLSTTPEWQHGMAYSALLQRLNCGQIDFRTFSALAETC